MDFPILLLGVALGLASVAPPGPITLLLVEVGAGSENGRSRGMRGGVGVAAAETITVGAAFALTIAGTALPPAVFTGVQVVSALILATFGLALTCKPASCRALVRTIEHPGRTMFAITALTPSIYAAWLALLAAMPFADRPSTLGAFALGLAVATVLWHVGLGTIAGRLGGRLSSRTLTTISRMGGVLMISLAGWVVFG